MTAPLRVLFVCTANICRSAYASVRAAQLLGEDSSVEVSSAGTHGWVDRPIDPPMAAELRARGADPSCFRSRRLTAEIVRDADLILTAETAHRDFIIDEWPAAFQRTFTLQQFADAVTDAALNLDPRTLVAGAARLRQAAQPSGNVPDPFGRGMEASAACAAHVDALLEVILQGLAPEVLTGLASPTETDG
jgi:protein-tyrosine-phosphatase